MKHRKYERIEGFWHKKTVDYFREKGFFDKEIEWCITEKVHGANFSFYLDQDSMLFAKRSAFLQDGENFYQCNRMISNESYKCQQIWDDLVSSGIELEELIIYGELFGGFYPHPDIKNIGYIRKIQKGVWYHPDVKFYAFDIWIKTDLFEGFLDYDRAIHYFEKNDLFHAKILYRDKFDACKMYSNEFPTDIPARFGLPPIEGNVCEGIVIKPIKPLETDDGDRVILKSKNDKFIEVSREKGATKTRKILKQMSDYAKETVDLLLPYINENRLRSVLSKFGEFERTEFKKVYKLFKEDVYDDFNINYDNLAYCDIVDLKMIDKEIGRLCVEVWRPVFLVESL